MEWILTVAIAFVVGALIGQKLKRHKTELQQRKSLRDWGKGRARRNKTSPKRVFEVQGCSDIAEQEKLDRGNSGGF